MARNKHHDHWFGLEEDGDYPSLKNWITGDRPNGVTRRMEYAVYDGLRECIEFSFQKRKLLLFGGAYFEESVPNYKVVKTLRSGTVLLEARQPKPDQL